MPRDLGALLGINQPDFGRPDQFNAEGKPELTIGGRKPPRDLSALLNVAPKPAPAVPPGSPYQGAFTDTPASKAVNEDVTRTVASVPGSILSNAIGLPGQVEQGAGWLAEKLGGPQQTTQQILPTPEDVRGWMKSKTPEAAQDWLFHDPKTTAASIVGGTMEAVAPIAANALRKGAVAGIKGARTLAREAVTPTAARVERNAAYDVLKKNDIRFNLDDYGNAVADTFDRLKDFDVEGTRAGRLLDNVIKDVTTRAAENRGPDWMTMENFRKRAGKIARLSSDKEERGAAVIIRDNLDNFRFNSDMSSNSMTRDAVNEATGKARELALRTIKHDELQGIQKAATRGGGIRKAIDAAGRGNSLIKTRAQKILDNPAAKSKYSAQQIKDLEKLAGTGLTELGGNAFGLSFSPSGMSQAASVAKTAGLTYFGGLPGVGLQVGGTAAKIGAVVARRKRLEKLMADVLVGEGPNGPRDPSRLAQIRAWAPYVALAGNSRQSGGSD